MIGVLSTAIGTVTAFLAETCRIEKQTAAYCNYTFIRDIGDSSTTTSYATTITGDNYVSYPVVITAGVEKLMAPTQVPTPSNSTSITANPTTGASFTGNVTHPLETSGGTRSNEHLMSLLFAQCCISWLLLV